MIKKIIITIVLICVVKVGWGQDIDPVEVLQSARNLAAQGKYQKALDKHIWFHNNALKYKPELSGIRVSIALASWVELGQKYPEALIALKRIRSDNEKRIYDGENNWELFYDAKAINNYLNEPSRTVKMFKSVHNRNRKFAFSCYDIVEEELVNAEEFGLCVQYLGDYDKRFMYFVKKREEDIKYASAQSGIMAQINTAASNKIFTKDVSRFLKILSNTNNNHQKAVEFQKKALNIFYNEEIVNAVKRLERRNKGASQVLE